MQKGKVATVLHAKTGTCYALAEHGCAVCYALCEFVNAHAILSLFSIVLLVAGLGFVVLRLFEIV